MANLRIEKVFGAINIGSFRISAMIAGLTGDGEMIVLGSGHRAADGIRRGYVTDMDAATHAIRDAIERAERAADTQVSSVWIGCANAGLMSEIREVDIEIGGRRIDQDDVEYLLAEARERIVPQVGEPKVVLHAQPAHYVLDGAQGVSNPRGLHAQRLAVAVHVMEAEAGPLRNLMEAVQSAHLEVEGVVGAAVASGHACLTEEERELGVAVVDFGAEVTHVSVHVGGMLVGVTVLPYGSNDLTDSVAGAFGVRRAQAERLKCVYGSAIASPTDHREKIPLTDGGEEIPRADLISTINGQLSRWTEDVAKALKGLGFVTGRGGNGRQIVLTGGGAELAGLADYVQQALAKPVRTGRPPAMKGLPEAHATPGFAALAGLVIYAAADPIDIRTHGSTWQTTARFGRMNLPARVMRAIREYF
ncbi:cell division protein FtsA [Croceicoccus naphthovorans]|uniref:Cell division protein FtsA n=1 Tax=Croceicoccus naphthovorans TaxID=1348774 RepID=A0A0G3XJH8_9SPHN|nr:cell division protein FtsA [Croceicoccus naphthovorans]AKM10754.1 cell division protein FtsA [Croceicoccus naphthovorans]MBB3988944.1 cell division protein FtsA [Croceicoccus naphthovorans]